MNRPLTLPTWLVVASMCLLPSVSRADASEPGTVVGYVTKIEHIKNCSSAWNGCIVVHFSAPIDGGPDCQWSAPGPRMAIDTGDPQTPAMQEYYRTMFSTIFAAHMAGLPVSVRGTGTCSIHGNIETIERLSIGLEE